MEGPLDYIYAENASKQQIDFDNMTKSSALRYGNMLGRRLAYMGQNDSIDDLLYIPYAHHNFDKEDIKMRLDLLVPENMYIFYHSKLVKQL